MNRESTSRAWRRNTWTGDLCSLFLKLWSNSVIHLTFAHTDVALGRERLPFRTQKSERCLQGEEELCRRCSSGVQKENQKLFVFPKKFKVLQPGAEVLSPEAHEKVLKVKTLVLDACHRQITYFPASLSIALAGVSIQFHAPCWCLSLSRSVGSVSTAIHSPRPSLSFISIINP